MREGGRKRGRERGREGGRERGREGERKKYINDENMSIDMSMEGY